MSIWEIYKAKKMGYAKSMFDVLFSKKTGAPHEWITEKVPYVIRQAAGGANISPVCIDKVVGGTVVWNQLLWNGDFADTEGWTAGGSRGTLAAENNELSYTITSRSTTWGNQRIQRGLSFTENHKYLVAFEFYALYTGDIGITLGGSPNIQGAKVSAAAGWNKYSTIIAAGSGQTTVQGVFASNSYSVGDTVKWRRFMVIDITTAFGTAIADYIYSLEQAETGAGVEWFKALFGEDFYRYRTNKLMSVNTSAHIMRDADNNIIGNYALDKSLTLRGIPKLDASNSLYYDGDIYQSNGTVTRYYGERPYEDGDVTDGSTMITDGTNTVYKLATPITETADPFINPQKVSKDGTEEYVDYAFSKGTRNVSIPAGHITKYKILL